MTETEKLECIKRLLTWQERMEVAEGKLTHNSDGTVEVYVKFVPSEYDVLNTDIIE